MTRTALAVVFVLTLAWTLPLEESHAATDSHQLLVVADLRGHALVIVDLAEPAATRRIALPGGPHELVRLPDGRVVASLEQAGALAVVDVSRGEVETVMLGGLPHGLTLHDGVLQVTDRSRGAVRQLRTSDWREEPAIAAGMWPHAVAALPAGGVAVADAGGNSLLLNGRRVQTSELPETVAVSPDGQRVATAGALGDAVDVFDSEGGRLLHVAVGGRPVRVAFSPDGTQIAVALSASARVALLDARSGEARFVPIGGLPDGLLYAGGVLFAGDLSAGRVVAIDATAARVLASYEVPAASGVLSAGAMLAFEHSGAVGGLLCPIVRQ
jgi:streptogramin lyase